MYTQDVLHMYSSNPGTGRIMAEANLATLQLNEDPDGFGESSAENESELVPEDKPQIKSEPIAIKTFATGGTVKIVLAGKSGAGKTTLIRTLFDMKDDTEEDSAKVVSAGHLTTEYSKTTFTRHGVTIEVTDTIGLVEEKDQRKQELIKLAEFTGGRADILVYCLSVDPAVKFRYSNPGIMQSLQETFGKSIWRQCIVALTFSNNAWDRINKKKKGSKKDVIISNYKQHIATRICCSVY